MRLSVSIDRPHYCLFECHHQGLYWFTCVYSSGSVSASNSYLQILLRIPTQFHRLSEGLKARIGQTLGCMPLSSDWKLCPSWQAAAYDPVIYGLHSQFVWTSAAENLAYADAASHPYFWNGFCNLLQVEFIHQYSQTGAHLKSSKPWIWISQHSHRQDCSLQHCAAQLYDASGILWARPLAFQGFRLAA